MYKSIFWGKWFMLHNKAKKTALSQLFCLAISIACLLLFSLPRPSFGDDAAPTVTDWEPGGATDLPKEPIPSLGYTEEAIGCIQDCIKDTFGTGAHSRPTVCACGCLETHKIPFHEKFCGQSSLLDESNIRTIDQPMLKGGIQVN